MIQNAATGTLIPTLSVPNVESQMDPADWRDLNDLFQILAYKRRGNRARLDYYEMRNLFRDLGIAIPPNLRNLEVAMGWPAKAVDQLARRVKLEGFVLPGGDVADWGIGETWTDNRMETAAPQAITSSLINPPAFLSVTLGDVAAGQPEVLVSMSDAMNSSGLWDSARRGVRAFMQVLGTDTSGDPLRVIMCTPRLAYGMTRDPDRPDRWEVRAVRHNLNRVPVEALIYRATLTRPFGASRISRAVRSITDSAMRTVVRSEVGAEFFSAPQRYLLGADEDMFEDETGARKSVWDLVMGRILAIPHAVDPDSGEPLEMPKVGQFPQVSMQPHTDHLHMWATLMSGETGLPLPTLGVVQDNPSSAEAIYAAKEDLVLEAEGAADGFAPAFVRAMVTAVQIRDNLPTAPPELRGLGVRWRDPSTPSRAAATDAVMKQIQMGVIPADSEVALEALGYDDTTIARVMADRRRAAGRALARDLANTSPATNPAPEPAAIGVPADGDGDAGNPAA